MPRYGTGLSPRFYVRRKSLTSGALGEDRFWRVTYSLINSRRTASRVLKRREVWGPFYTAVFTARLVRRLLGFGPQLVSLEKLKPGQSVSIEAIDPRTLTPSEKQRYKR